jgi:hypothetical protein
MEEINATRPAEEGGVADEELGPELHDGILQTCRIEGNALELEPILGRTLRRNGRGQEHAKRGTETTHGKALRTSRAK